MIYRDSIQVLVLVTLLFYFYTHFQLQSAKEISKGKLLLILRPLSLLKSRVRENLIRASFVYMHESHEYYLVIIWSGVTLTI